jgi:Tol biopolymer transport system component/DNA-binding winged helix-turn-helix (wHTH) protein
VPVPRPSDLVRFGPYGLRKDTQELFKHGLRLRLTPQAFQVLRLLLENPGQMVSREELHQALWPADTFVDFDHGLNNAIKRIRDVLAESADNPVYIETLPRLGYRFIGQVLANGNGDRTALVASESGATIPSLPETLPSALPQRSRTFGFSVAAFVILSVCAIAGLLWVSRPPLLAPTITETVQLTNDRRDKFGSIATDGLRVYFSEIVSNRWTVAEVPVSGGETVLIHTPFQDSCVLGISPNRQLLLIGEGPLIEDHPLWTMPVVGGPPHRLANVVGHAAAWSPDGQRLAFAHGSEVYLANADGTEPRKIVPSDANPSIWVWSLAWSPDGRQLDFNYTDMDKHGSTEWEVATDGRNLHPVPPRLNDPRNVCCAAWTRDGRYYFFQSWDRVEAGLPWDSANIYVVREAVGFFRKANHEPVQLTVGPVHFFDQVLSPDSNVIYTTSSVKHGELLRFDGKSRQGAPYLSGISAEGVAFSRDGAWVAYVKFPEGELWRSRTDGSEALELTTHPIVTTYGPKWSPDGKQIAFSGYQRILGWQLYMVSANGSAPQPLADSANGRDPSWSPDGDTLLFGVTSFGSDGKIRRMNLRTHEVSDFPGSKGFFAPHWSPDGHYLAAMSQPDSKLMVFDFSTGKWLEWVASGNNGWPDWSQDSKSVYFLDLGTRPGVFRVALNEYTPRRVVSLDGFRLAGAKGAWFSLTPNDEPLILRNVGGGTEIYGLHWDTR